MLHHFQQLGTLPEEVLPRVSTTSGDVVLILAVDDFIHACLQNAVFVCLQQRIPVATPNDLYDVPSGTAEDSFKLLYDLAIASHGAV